VDICIYIYSSLKKWIHDHPPTGFIHFVLVVVSHLEVSKKMEVPEVTTGFNTKSCSFHDLNDLGMNRQASHQPSSTTRPTSSTSSKTRTSCPAAARKPGECCRFLGPQVSQPPGSVNLGDGIGTTMDPSDHQVLKSAVLVHNIWIIFGQWLDNP